MSKPVWQRKRIGDLFDVQLGKMLNEKAREGELFPYLANFNVRWGCFDLTRLNKMSFSEKEREKFFLRNGDLLMCEGGEIGRCAVWIGSDKQIYYQKALHRLRALNKNIAPEFIYYYMQHIATKGELPKLVGVTSIAHLTREKLLSLKVPVPSRKEQDKMVAYLQAWDLAIEKTERLIVAKEQRFKWLVRKIINNQCEDWQTSYIKDLCKPIIRKNNVNDQNVITSSAQYGLVSQLMFYSKNVSGKDLSGYYLIRKGEFAYNRSASNGYPYGAIKRLDSCQQGVLSTLYMCFRLEGRYACDSDFICHYFESGVLNKSLRGICQEGARSHGLLNVTKEDFFNLKVFFPDINQQQKIAKALNMAKREIQLLNKKLEAYRKQKRGLMQKLLTGQWQVKIEDEEV